jgi:transposase-like protein
MEAASVSPRIVKVSCCSKTAPCPTCGKRGRRKNKAPLLRRVRTIAYKQIAFLEIEYAEYRARCSCCKTFRSAPPGVAPKCLYDNKVREAVLDRILQDGMNIQRVRGALARDFLLDLSEGFVYDCLHKEASRLDMAEYRQWTLEHFSGTLCVDELHLGRFTLLLATDPVVDFPVGFALVSRNDQDHMRRFLKNLKTHGVEPKTVITDGSSLYPALLAEIWADAQHQLCVFHVMQDLNKYVLNGVKRLRRAMARRGNGGRKRKRGRPTKAQRRARKQQQQSVKDKAHFVFKRRTLIVTRRENMNDQERKDLRTMLQYLPGLATLRKFVDRLHALFETNQSLHQARCRRAALIGNQDFCRVPELAEALKMLEHEKFEKMIAFLHGPANRRIRTNNHVERANRKLRYFEKLRYKWRRRRSIVRFIVLAIRQWWNEKLSADAPSIKVSSRTPPPKTSCARKAA